MNTLTSGRRKAIFGLQDRNDQFQRDIPPHVENPHPAGDRIDIGILETAQVALVNRIQQIAAEKVHGRPFLAAIDQICTQSGPDKGICRRRRFGVIRRIITVLGEIVLDIDRRIGIVQQFPAVGEFVFDLHGPAGSRNHRQIHPVRGLVFLAGVYIGKRITDVEAVERMNVQCRLKTLEECSTGLVGIDGKSFVGDLPVPGGINVIVNPVCEESDLTGYIF